jgi:cell division transport system permease protein
MITFWRIAHAGLRNFFRNAWLSTAATAVMTVTLSLLTFSYISNSALNSTIKSVTQKIDVSLYLKDSVTPAQVKTLEAEFQKSPNVQSVSYLSKADALEAYKKQNVDNLKLLQAISATDNPLPATLQVKVKDPNNLKNIAAIINKPDVRELQSDPASYSGDRKATVDRIVGFSNFFQRTSLVASIIFVVISILIIFNTIRMAIFTRRSEIEIMKLVGATNWFIRGPFIVEAALYGVLAAVIALIFCYGLVLGGASKLTNYIDVSATIHVFRAYPGFVILAELAAGIFIGAVASFLAMSRHLKL